MTGDRGERWNGERLGDVAEEAGERLSAERQTGKCQKGIRECREQTNINLGNRNTRKSLLKHVACSIEMILN